MWGVRVCVCVCAIETVVGFSCYYLIFWSDCVRWFDALADQLLAGSALVLAPAAAGLRHSLLISVDSWQRRNALMHQQLLSAVICCFFLLPLFNTVLTKGKHRLEKIYMNQQQPFVCPCVLRARLCAFLWFIRMCFFFFPEINQMLWAPRGSQRVSVDGLNYPPG